MLASLSRPKEGQKAGEGLGEYDLRGVTEGAGSV